MLDLLHLFWYCNHSLVEIYLNPGTHLQCTRLCTRNRFWDSYHSLLKIYQTLETHQSCCVPGQEQLLGQLSLSGENLPEQKDLPAVYQDRTRSGDSHHSLVKIYQNIKTYLQCTKTGPDPGTAITLW